MKNVYIRKLAPLAAALVAAGAFYALSGSTAVMNAATQASGYVRFAVGRVTALCPLSVYELGGTLLVLLVLFLLVRSVVLSARDGFEQVIKRFLKPFIRGLLRRLLPLVTAAAIVWAVFLWLWCSLYFSTPFYTGVMRNENATEAELYAALEYFIDSANELAPLVNRDENGHIAENAENIISRAPGVVPYDKLCEVFPKLERLGANKVKPMVYSELMSQFRFTGVYMGLTGEANVNVNTPLAFLPATAAHELAHSHGVGKEEEANFLGILAATESDDVLFRYSGYISGISELAYALNLADSAAFRELSGTYSELVRLDLRDNYSYWSRYSSTRASNAVDKAYDRYLKSNGQPLGVQSYGACVNLLAEWVKSAESEYRNQADY
jgi:hypothetical protein